MRCRLINYRSRSYPKREQLLTLEIQDVDFASTYDAMKGQPVDVSIKYFRNRRSKDANAYAWVIMDRLAAALSAKHQMPLTSVDVYREAIREIPGVSEVVAVRSEAVYKLRRGWSHNGIGWQSAVLGPSDAAGYTDVILYYGSSSFDVRQMGALLDYLQAEAQTLGVQTDTPEMVEKYKYYWAQAEAERRSKC